MERVRLGDVQIVRSCMFELRVAAPCYRDAGQVRGRDFLQCVVVGKRYCLGEVRGLIEGGG